MSNITHATKYLLLIFLLLPFSLYALGDLTAQKEITVFVELGDKNNSLRFKPSSLAFETGKLYKLVISNPSKQKHYFTAESFPGLYLRVKLR